MEADWQRRGHPLHDSSTASRPPTLPSVAELIASSTPPAGTIPAYHQPSSSLPPIQCSTQHSSPPTAALANAPSPTEQSYFGAPVRRASHASPTLSAASTAISEPHHYQQPIAQKEPARGVQGMTTESYQSQQDHSPRPISGRRQDSAVSKEGSTFAPPSEPGLSYSHRSPTYSHHSPSSSLAAQLITQPSAPAHSSAASIYPSPAPFDHVTSSVGHSNGHSDHPNTSNTRQQRYNVRFAANYTSANMPPVQRPRPSPPLPAATSPQETNGPPTPPDRPQSPSDLKIHEWLVGPKKKADLNAHPIPNLNDSAGEKCHRCKEVWKRQPLDNASAWAQQETAKSIQDFAKATDKHISGLRQHARDNEVEYEKWKAYHSSGECPIRPSPPPEPHFTNGHSNKRKSEGPHSDMPKVPKITHENHGPTAPAIRP